VRKEIRKESGKQNISRISKRKLKFWEKERRTKSKEGLAKRREFL